MRAQSYILKERRHFKEDRIAFSLRSGWRKISFLQTLVGFGLREMQVFGAAILKFDFLFEGGAVEESSDIFFLGRSFPNGF